MQQPRGDNGVAGRQGPLDVADLGVPPWGGRAIKWGIAGVVLIFLIIALTWARGVYTNLLWFDNLGYVDVFKKILITKIWLFFAGAGVFAVLAAPNIWLVFRATKSHIPSTLTPEAYHLVRRFLGAIAGLVVFIASIAFGAATGARWETILQYINATPFTKLDADTGALIPLLDPIFNKGIDFFVFTLPLLGFVRGWFLGAAIVTLLFVLGLYVLLLGLRERGIVIPQSVKIHVASIGALLFIVIAVGHWLGRYELLYSSQGLVYGVGYTDETARMTTRAILAFVALASGGLIFSGAFVQGYRLMAGAVGLWIVMAILVGGLYPSLIQRFQVEPNEYEKEHQ